MKLADALGILDRQPGPESRTLRLGLGCSFTPSHLKTFLAAELVLLCPGRHIQIEEGIYGDLVSSLWRFAEQGLDGCVVAVEWTDLDPRLGIRSTGSWDVSALPDIAMSANEAALRIRDSLLAVAATTRVLLALPSLNLPPVSFTSPVCLSSFEMELEDALATLRNCARRDASVTVLNPRWLQEHRTLSVRGDSTAELANGFPYTRPYASFLAETLALLTAPPPPKKGLITDLDETLWKGILGEVGPDGVAWDLNSHAQIHGVYQRLVQSLASAGVLIAVASKNDSELVERAFTRTDLLVRPEAIFPRHANWGPKSSTVASILSTWNIGEDSVVFVDDNLAELAEVRLAFPGVTTLQFPTGHAEAIRTFFYTLRRHFGRTSISAEDTFRTHTIRQGANFQQDSRRAPSTEDFLRQLNAVVNVIEPQENSRLRAFDLINKTNQFNLNGRRIELREWNAQLARPETLQFSIEYSDRFGRLGTISAVLADLMGPIPRVEAWVMSCRAFSRRIEFATFKQLFEMTGAPEILLDFQATDRNGPFRDFLRQLSGSDVRGPVVISRQAFDARCPTLYFNRAQESFHVSHA